MPEIRQWGDWVRYEDRPILQEPGMVLMPGEVRRMEVKWTESHSSWRVCEVWILGA